MAITLQTDRTWAGIFCPASHAPSLYASAKFPYAPQPDKATIVLSVFTRSFSNDGETKSNPVLIKEIILMNRDQKRVNARQKARAWVFCLWGEGSFCLDLWLLWIKPK